MIEPVVIKASPVPGCSYLSLLVAVVALFAHASARAQPAPAECAVSGIVQWVPSNPSTLGGPVGIKVSVPEVSQRYTYEMIAMTFTSPAVVAVDVVFLNDAALAPLAFPGYVFTRRLDQTDLYVSTLSASAYTFVVTVRAFDPPRSITSLCDSVAYGGAKTTTLQVPQLVPVDPIPTAAVVEFYHASLNHYFMTIDAREIQDLDSGVHPGWTRTGQSFLGHVPAGTPVDVGFYAGGVAGSLAPNAAVRRYYGLPSAGLDSHFFTVDAYEKAALESPSNPLSWAWKVETPEAFQILPAPSGTGDCPRRPGFGMVVSLPPPDVTNPVYRLWNGRADANHRYTTDLSIRQEMIDKGWIPEGYGPMGVVMCAPRAD